MSKGDGIQCRVRRSRGDWAGPLRFLRLADATPCWPFGCSKMPDTSIFCPIFGYFMVFSIRISPVGLSNERMKPRTLATSFGTLPFIWRPHILPTMCSHWTFCDQLHRTSQRHVAVVCRYCSKRPKFASEHWLLKGFFSDSSSTSASTFRELCSPRVPGNSSFGWERERVRGTRVPWLLTKSFWCFKIKDKVDSIKKIASKSIYCFLAGFHSYIQCVGMCAWAIWQAERYMAVHEWR